MKIYKKSTLLLLLNQTRTASGKGKCPFGYEAESASELAQEKSSVGTDILYPSQLFTCSSGTMAQTTTNFSRAMYMDVAQAVIDEYEKLVEVVRDNFNPRATFTGCMIRAAGHDFMDYRVGAGRGGSDGCINFEDADNNYSDYTNQI